MESLPKGIVALTSLLALNQRRVNRYKAFVDKSKDMELKILFMQYAIQAQTFAATLEKWRHAYGVTSSTGKRANVFRTTWTLIKDAFIVGGRNIFLSQCEIMEKSALKIYKAVMMLSDLPAAATNDILLQADELEKVQFKLKTLRTGSTAQLQATA